MEKKKYKLKGTFKQKAAIKAITTGASVGQAMRQSGYSPVSAKNPKALTNSKYFKDALEVLDDKLYLNELHNLALADDDKRAKLQAIDMLFKLKSRYPKESIDLEISQKRDQVIEPD